MRRPNLHPGQPLGCVPTLEDTKRFLDKVEVDESSPLVRGAHCWTWTACTDGKGYGQMKLAGRARWAHRIAFRLFRSRDLRNGEDVDHICHNRSCVNPRHLRATSRSLNSSRNQVPAFAGDSVAPF